jgi:hypothetical protein
MSALTAIILIDLSPTTNKLGLFIFTVAISLIVYVSSQINNQSQHGRGSKFTVSYGEAQVIGHE